FAEPKYWGNEKKYVNQALKSTWISGGEYVDKFEANLAEFHQNKYAITTSNGTTALHAAFLALGLKAGDEIVIPSFTYLAAANVAINMGLKIIFCDVDPNTWCITKNKIEECITKDTKAIVAIHTYGNMCDMDDLHKISRKYNLYIIEDAAEAFGSKYKGKYAGSIGDIGTLSFHSSKTITTGEGGAVLCNKKQYYDNTTLIRNHGVSKKRYYHIIPGLNFRLTNLQSAIGLAQMEKSFTIMNRKNEIADLYYNNLQNIPNICFQEITKNTFPVIWAFAVLLNVEKKTISRDVLMKKLKKDGIETRPGFYSADTMPKIYGTVNTPVASKISRNIIVLPSSPRLSKSKINYIVNSLKKHLTNDS
ncbi:DegT/DnrJ/EryC1/StrS family aminotransferase, partial [Alphaproteobacteria bacterium]|nr:DegT/DnrJ/EryC1/StrS family aminotransferase [Alphaproteobacteria bacterium]